MGDVETEWAEPISQKAKVWVSQHLEAKLGEYGGEFTQASTVQVTLADRMLQRYVASEGLDVRAGKKHGSQFNFAPWGDVEMVARMLSLREHEGVDAVDPVGTGLRLHSSPDVVGGERWWGSLGGRAGGGEFLLFTYWRIGWAGGDVERFGA